MRPALLEFLAGSDAVCLREQVAAIAAGKLAPLVVSDAEAFIRMNRHHLEAEEAELLPMALRLITDGDLKRMRDAMLGSPRSSPVRG
ncbi:MAG: hypothetical protein ACREVW_17615 [Burkholderiales bacterium]